MPLLVKFLSLFCLDLSYVDMLLLSSMSNFTINITSICNILSKHIHIHNDFHLLICKAAELFLKYLFSMVSF
uniref:Uncharacterized protein n=1 Tax=Arundo donax TaxID=35708 RepID=A0A0A9FDQ5_ARUDO